MQSPHGSHLIGPEAASGGPGLLLSSAAEGLQLSPEPSTSAVSSGLTSCSLCSAASREASKALRAARIACGGAASMPGFGLSSVHD